jgi:hypothetical protein
MWTVEFHQRKGRAAPHQGDAPDLDAAMVASRVRVSANGQTTPGNRSTMAIAEAPWLPKPHSLNSGRLLLRSCGRHRRASRPRPSELWWTLSTREQHAHDRLG